MPGGDLAGSWTDYWIHKSLMIAKLPVVFLDLESVRVSARPEQDPTVYA